MSWFIFSLLDVVLGASANILRKILLRDDRNDVYASAVLFQLMGAVIVGVIAFWHGFVFPPIQEYAVNFLFVAVLWGLATLTLFKAYQYIEASEVSIITTMEAIVVIIIAHFVLHETFTFINAIGTVFIILAVAYISHVSSAVKFSKGVFFASIYCIFGGLGIVNDTFMVKHNDPLSYLAIGFLLPGLFLLVVHPNVVTKMKPLFQPATLKKSFVFTLAYSFSAIMFVFALVSGGEASQVGTIAQSSIVLTVILAIFFLKERDHLLKKFVCAILVTIGVLLLR